jgi:arylsulfatase A-like enzyme
VSHPNILYILADDLGWADLSLHGSPVRTPCIDQLAREGVELLQHYVCPMCTPTRASLLTGRHPGRFGPHATVPSNAPVLPDGYATLATVLRDAGYDTGLFGKWHLGSDPRFGPNQYGFNTAYGSLAGGIDPYNHRYKRGEFSVTWHRNGRLVEERGHVTDLIVREAREWIESRDRPWFCYVPFTAVHVPVKPTQEWLARYTPEHFDDNAAKDVSFKKYAAYTSHMDEGIGRLLESLERTCRRENTIVVFSSDNGAINDCPLHGTDRYPGWQEAYPRLGSNAPFRGVKAQLYEGGIRTPTVVSWRGTLSPGTMDHPVQVTDWMPTFAGLAGAELRHDPRYDGRDIGPLLTGEETAPAARRLYWNFQGGRHLAVRHGDWKLIAHNTDESTRHELFDIGSDPYEENDLATSCPEKVRELSQMIEEERRLDGSSARDDVDSPRMP